MRLSDDLSETKWVVKKVSLHIYRKERKDDLFSALFAEIFAPFAVKNKRKDYNVGLRYR